MSDDFDGFEHDMDQVLGLDDEGSSYEEFSCVIIPLRYDRNGNPLKIRLGCELTDVGNARRFAAMFAQNVRYCRQLGKWFVWDGRRWLEDQKNEVMDMARDVADTIELEAEYVHNANRTERLKDKERIIKHAKATQSDYRLNAMLSQASSMPDIAVTSDEFDRDPMLMTCLNGTLDLELLELRPHRRQDMIRKIVPENYAEGAASELWDSFLRRVIPDAEVRAYIQRVAGYSLTGKTSEEKLFYMCGPTASGKSTFIEAVKAALGDYAGTADFDAFLKRKHAGAPRNDIARLDGSRFVSSIEVDEGASLAEALVKTITGNERVTARFLHKEFFDFMPQFKLFFVANVMPRINAKDAAIWRRIDVIPFNEEIPEEERDPRVKERLRDPDFAGEAILTWAVEGCRQWQQIGLASPDVVKATTAQYRLKMSELKGFIEDCCVIDPKEYTLTSVLYSDYEDHCAKRRMVPLDRKKFGERLREYGCQYQMKRSERWKGVQRVWRGIGIRIPNDDSEDGLDEDGVPRIREGTDHENETDQTRLAE